MAHKKFGKLVASIQNLHRRNGDKIFEATGNVLRHGRIDVRIAGHYGPWDPALSLEWALGESFCHLGVDVDGLEHQAKFSSAVPGVASWLTVHGVPNVVLELLNVSYAKGRDTYDCQRTIKASVHDWAAWWKVWARSNSWTRGTPRWREGSFNVIDALFGDRKHERKVISTHDVEIPMPEKSYKARVTLSRGTWTRPRWPFAFGPSQVFYEKLRFDVDLKEPIPYPGKGENSWDQGMDGLYGISGDGGLEEAIAATVRSVLQTRRKRTGSIAWKPPASAEAEA